MTGIDANVLVRYLTEDDPVQSPKAVVFIESEANLELPLHVSLIVLCEVVWTLRKSYGYPKSQIIEVLEKLLLAREIVFEKQFIVSHALEVYRDVSAGFADCLIAETSKSQRVSTTVTFDKAAAKLDGFTLLE